MCGHEKLRSGDDVVVALSAQSSQLIVFSEEFGDYCVLRIAGEPATDQIVEVNNDLLWRLVWNGDIEVSSTDFGMSYRLARK